MMSLLQFRVENESSLKKIIKRRKDAMDCVVCALEFLKIIPEPMSQLLRTMAFQRGLFIPEIIAILVYLYPLMNIREHKIMDLTGFLDMHLSPGCATIIGIDFTDGAVVMGHVMIIGRHHRGGIFLMDNENFINGMPAIFRYLAGIGALPVFTVFMQEMRPHSTPSPKVRSEMERAILTARAIRERYAESRFLEIPGLTAARIRRLRTCRDIPTFLYIMDVIDDRLRRLLLTLPLHDMMYLRGLLSYQLGLLYEPAAITRGRLRIPDGCITIAFDDKKLERFWYVGCHKGVIGAIDPHGNEKTGSSKTIAYIMTPDRMEQGQIRDT